MNHDPVELRNLERRLVGRGRLRPVLGRVVRAVLYALSLAAWLAVETVLAVLLTTFVTAPVLLGLTARKLLRRRNVFRPRDVLLRDGVRVSLPFFNVSSTTFELAALFPLVITGALRLVGPALQDASEPPRPGDNYIRAQTPGLLSLWFVRESARIAHEGRFRTQWEQVFRQSPAYDALLLLRGIPALCYHHDTAGSAPRVNILGIWFTNVRMTEAVELLGQSIAAGRRRRVYYVNPDCLNKAVSDERYHAVLQRADTVFPDGIGIALACKLLHSPLVENVNGTDMLPFLCEYCAARGYSLYLLGAKPGIAAMAADRLRERFPALRIAGTHHGYFDWESQNDSVIRDINASGASVVLVAFGAPMQERWIDGCGDRIRAPLLIGVGGLLDFYSGVQKRAPRWLRELGLEWFYRLTREPGRMWRRYVMGNPLFLFRVTKWHLSGGNHGRT